MTESQPMMRAARLHEPGGAFRIDRIPMPQLRASDVLIKVVACSVVPNLKAIVSGKYWHTLPPLPAVYGLDASGIVAAVGADVRGIAPGQRVYVNPVLYCGTCAYCRNGSPQLCTALALRGYFGFSANALPLLREYPYGGHCEYLTASPQSLVPLPDSVSFAQGARFGYLGTAFAALEVAGVIPGSSVLVNGATGTLGLGAVLVALAMGATRILATGRNPALLAALGALEPQRIATHVLQSGPLIDWMRERTEGLGPDVMVDCLGRGAPAESTMAALAGLKRGGRAVNIGALAAGVSIDPMAFMLNQIRYIGSTWFTTAQAVRMAELAAGGLLRLDVLQHREFALEALNDAVACAADRPGGFANLIVCP